MRWTKKKREEFKDSIDFLLAMTDMAEQPSNRTELRSVFGKRNVRVDKQLMTTHFKEAEIITIEPGAITAVQDDYAEAAIMLGVDPRTDLPPRFDTSCCFMDKGYASFYRFSSVPIKQLRGRKLLSQWFAKLSVFGIDLETGVGAGGSDIVFRVGGGWVKHDTMGEGFIRSRGALPDEIVDSIADDDPAKTNSICEVLAGLTFTRDFQWRVVIYTPEDNSFSISTDSRGAAAAFADRTGDTPSGRRPALRNWVTEHMRKARKTNEGDELLKMVTVRKHLRGRIPFTWCGLQCELVVSPFDIRHNERLAAQRALLTT